MNREQWIQKRSQYDALQGAIESYFACARQARSVAESGMAVRTVAPEPAAHAGDSNKVVVLRRNTPSAIVLDR